MMMIVVVLPMHTGDCIDDDDYDDCCSWWSWWEVSPVRQWVCLPGECTRWKNLLFTTLIPHCHYHQLVASSHYHLCLRITVNITFILDWVTVSITNLQSLSLPGSSHYHLCYYAIILFYIHMYKSLCSLLPFLGPFGPLWNPFHPGHKTLAWSPLEEVWWCRPSLITADVILENCPKTHKGSATKCPQLTATVQTTPPPPCSLHHQDHSDHWRC